MRRGIRQFVNKQRVGKYVKYLKQYLRGRKMSTLKPLIATNDQLLIINCVHLKFLYFSRLRKLTAEKHLRQNIQKMQNTLCSITFSVLQRIAKLNYCQFLEGFIGIDLNMKCFLSLQQNAFKNVHRSTTKKTTEKISCFLIFAFLKDHDF